MDRIAAEDLNLFSKNSRFLIGGLSGSGKSYFCSNLIKKYHSVFDNIIVIGSDLEGVSEFITRNDSFNPFEDSITGRVLIIFDDVIFNKNILKIASEVFVRGRHLNISSIFLTQNLYFSDNNFRIISLNCTHVVLFQMRDLKQIKYFASSFLSDNKVSFFVNLYKKIVLNGEYQYLLVDFSLKLNSKLKIRTCILDECDYERVFEI